MGPSRDRLERTYKVARLIDLVNLFRDSAAHTNHVRKVLQRIEENNNKDANERGTVADTQNLAGSGENPVDNNEDLVDNRGDLVNCMLASYNVRGPAPSLWLIREEWRDLYNLLDGRRSESGTFISGQPGVGMVIFFHTYSIEANISRKIGFRSLCSQTGIRSR